jgi:hypothetical protein
LAPECDFTQNPRIFKKLNPVTNQGILQNMSNSSSMNLTPVNRSKNFKNRSNFKKEFDLTGVKVTGVKELPKFNFEPRTGGLRQVGKKLRTREKVQNREPNSTEKKEQVKNILQTRVPSLSRSRSRNSQNSEISKK